MVRDEQARAWEEKANESETRSALDVPIQSAVLKRLADNFWHIVQHHSALAVLLLTMQLAM